MMLMDLGILETLLRVMEALVEEEGMALGIVSSYELWNPFIGMKIASGFSRASKLELPAQNYLARPQIRRQRQSNPPKKAKFGGNAFSACFEGP